MALFRRLKRGTRLFFATDIHGSEQCFRKWLNAAQVYEVDVVILGGDITGKSLVPLVKENGSWSGEFLGKRAQARTHEELARLQQQIRTVGSYDLLLTPDEKEVLDASPQKIEAAFHAAVLQSIQRWVVLSDERLSQAGVPGFVILGNDDFPEVADPFAAAHHLTYAEERICELPGGWELLSFGYSTPTPWDTPRELSEEEIEKRLEALVGKLRQPNRAIFNIHCPPRDTHLDQAPKLDDDLRMVPSVGGVELASVGSTAVRSIIERYRPPLALHGHVHDSAAAQKLGSSLCINPGSTYGEGVLRGAFVELSTDGDVQRWQLVEA